MTQSKKGTDVGDRTRPCKFAEGSYERWVQAKTIDFDKVPAESNCGLGEHYSGVIIDGHIVGSCLGK